MSDVLWEQGKQDSCYGLYSESRFSKDQIANHREEFFATGTKFVDVLLDRAKRYFGPLPRQPAPTASKFGLRSRAIDGLCDSYLGNGPC